MMIFEKVQSWRDTDAGITRVLVSFSVTLVQAPLVFISLLLMKLLDSFLCDCILFSCKMQIIKDSYANNVDVFGKRKK